MIIGQIVGGNKLELDLPTLVDPRLLIQANSGGGKSWLLRLIAERAGIQTIVLDNEGEFASLREAVDVLLVGAGGELRADPRHAALLARRLLEYKVSAVVDLYELKLSDRRRFVKLFLESLIHLPRDLWRPTLVILDEAHIYCPERGSGDAESTDAVISLMSQGRKRGFAGIIATQRLSKLHKDAAAEANNVIIGRTWLDADQVRAGDALGLSKADRLKLREVGRASFTLSAQRLASPESCTSARNRFARHIRARASVIFSPRRRHRERFAECWPSLQICHRKLKRKSVPSMNRVGELPNWSAKSKALPE
jgi:DNA helicase HerA-like ATPase